MKRFSRPTPLQCAHPHRQQGIASVLTLMLVGMSLTVTVLGASYYVYGRQSQSIATHAQTQAQLNAWTGAHIVQAYLDDLYHTDRLDAFMDLSTQQPIPLQLNASGLHGQLQAYITHIQAEPPLIVAQITGAAAQSTRAQANAILEVVYEVTLPAKECTEGKPLSSVLIKGNVSITGGESGFETHKGLMDMIVDGDMSISQASQAKVSACAKGNIYIDGGGVKDGAKIYSETGYVHLNKVTPPKNADIWARSVKLENFGEGDFLGIRAGSYWVDVVDSNRNVLGQAYMGGILLADTAYGGSPLAKGVLPWRAGMLIPFSEGAIRIENQGRTQWLLDLSKTQINQLNGAVSNIQKAAQTRESHAPTLPDVLYFMAKEVDGGTIQLNTQRVDELWGDTLHLDGYNGSYNTIQAAGSMRLQTQTRIGKLTVGGDVVLQSDYTKLEPSSASIAGLVRFSEQQPVPAEQLASTVTSNTQTTTPGLPGRPFCDAQMPEVHAAPYKTQANYVFETIGGKPYVTIRNVKQKSTDQSIDGIYPMDGSNSILQSLMVCDDGNHQGCAQNSSSGVWDFDGIERFPVGTLWFDNDVTFIPNYAGLVNTIISKGKVDLGNDTSTKNKVLTAPSHAEVAAICSNPGFIPVDLCREVQKRSAIALGNMAVMTEKSLLLNGWTVHGNIQVGEGLNTAANASVIYGTVAVGLNNPSQGAMLSSGGFIVKSSAVTEEQLIQPGGQQCVDGSSNSASSAGTGTATSNASGSVTRIKWSRYL